MVAEPIDRERTIQSARETLRGGVPPENAWIENLSREHLVQFAVELSEAVRVWAVTGDDNAIEALLDAWEATSEIDADSELTERLSRPRQEKEYIDWPARS